MAIKVRWQGLVTLLALAGLVVALFCVPAAETAPGDTADLTVSKTDTPDPVTVGDVLTYSVQVANLGPQGASDVTVTDRLPNHADYLSAVASSGTCVLRGPRVRCALDRLAADPSQANAVTVTIRVRPQRAGTIANTVSVDSGENDPVEANDIAETSTVVQKAPPVSTCRGEATTLAGTERPDRLVGTVGDDVIAGLGGGDEVLGRGGSDLICPGPGRDRVLGGPGGDRVFGGRGGDQLFGGRGRDRLSGNPGTDLLTGGRGADHLRGGGGFDRCFGGSGADSISCEDEG